MAVCVAVSEVLGGSHKALDSLFEAAGAPGPPPDLPHHSKWKMWLHRAGNDPNVDSLALVGNLIEEFMDVPPRLDEPMDLPPRSDAQSDEFYTATYDAIAAHNERRDRLNAILEEHGFRYYRGGRVLPNGEVPLAPATTNGATAAASSQPAKPSTLEELLRTLIRGLPRAMHPLSHRRKGAHSLTFNSEYDIQDLLHSQLRPWIADIRPEEYTPSYAGSSTRMDFLLPAHQLVLETKRVRDKNHAVKIGDELIIDIEHYRQHPECHHLWCVVYDPLHLIQNPSGLATDLEGARMTPDGTVQVRVFVFSA